LNATPGPAISRELENLLKRLTIIPTGPIILPEHLPTHKIGRMPCPARSENFFLHLVILQVF
jgi:hypothetical protein